MNKILVPTDFSDNARNALTYALELAHLFDSQIHLLHAYWMPSKTGMFKSVESYMLDDIKPEMKRWEEWTRERIDGDTKVRHTILRDDIVHAVGSVAEQEKIDLIVMGTQGASGLKEVFIGSTTGSVLNHCRLPLLAIPNGFAYRPVRNIVLAIDDQDVSSFRVMEPLVQLAKATKAKVLVFHQEREDGAGVDPTVGDFLKDIDHSFYYELDSGDLKGGISSFVKQHEADLLCMIRRPKWLFERLFGSSVTSKTVFDCPVPLLVLRDH